VIHESCYWKAPLLRAANWLEHLRIEESTVERSLVRAERELFVGFYAIRKLLETFKLSPLHKKHEVFSNALTMHKDGGLYERPPNRRAIRFGSHTHVEKQNLEILCNQFIHSYVFVTAQQEDGSLAGAYVSSDGAKG